MPNIWIFILQPVKKNETCPVRASLKHHWTWECHISKLNTNACNTRKGKWTKSFSEATFLKIPQVSRHKFNHKNSEKFPNLRHLTLNADFLLRWHNVQSTSGYTVFCWPFFPIRDLWIWGITPERQLMFRNVLSDLPPHQIVRVHSPPPAIVALMRESSSSSPLMASCKWRGVILFTFRSFDAFPASSRTWAEPKPQTQQGTACVEQQPRRLTSAVRYSRIAALYTAAVAPTLPWLVVRDFRCLWIRPTGNCGGQRVKYTVSRNLCYGRPWRSPRRMNGGLPEPGVLLSESGKWPWSSSSRSLYQPSRQPGKHKATKLTPQPVTDLGLFRGSAGETWWLAC